MRFNNDSKAQAIAAFNLLAEPVRTQMQLSSVRLTNGNFTGSGVLVIDGQANRGIVTAKHNLAAKDGMDAPLEWDQDEVDGLVAGFLTDLRVGYGPLSLPIAPQNRPVPTLTENLTPQNSAVEFRGGDGSWDYDLMFISLDPGLDLRTYIDANAAHRISYGNAGNFYQGNMVNRAVFVTGFGDIQDAQGTQAVLTHSFQVRNATVTARLATVMRHEDPDANFTNVLIVGASNNSSTAPGDSGGPMLSVGPNARVFLLGASVGSNYQQNEMLPNDPITSNASTFLYWQGALF